MNALTLAEMKELAALFAQSRLFGDLQTPAAFVKIQAGSELGFGPYASMTSFDIVKGKCELNANAQATLLKRSGRYDYKITELTNDACEIEFFEVAGEAGRSLGKSRFTLADAQRAQISSDMYRKYPRNMLFSRAMTNGVAWYCPDAIGLHVYGEGELPGSERSTEAPDAPEGNVARLAGKANEADPADEPAMIERNGNVARLEVAAPMEPCVASDRKEPEQPISFEKPDFVNETFSEKLDRKHAALVNEIPAASLKGKKGTSPEEIARRLNAAIAERDKAAVKVLNGPGWDDDGLPVHSMDDPEEPMKLTKADGLTYVDRVLMQIGRIVPKANFSNGVRRGHVCDVVFEAFQYQPKPEDLDRLMETLKGFHQERLKKGLAKLEKMEPK